MLTYSDAYTKVQKSISDVQFPENRFKFATILNDFWSSKIWDTQNQILFTVLQNPENPGIHPNHNDWPRSSNYLNEHITLDIPWVTPCIWLDQVPRLTQ